MFASYPLKEPLGAAMNYPSFTYRGFVAIGHPDKLPNGRINGNFTIHAEQPFGEIVHRTDGMANCDTRDEAMQNMCIIAEAWIDAHLGAWK